jgi:hypothetical protein
MSGMLGMIMPHRDAQESDAMEMYGDVHLHYDGYPEYNGYKSGSCKWNANAQAPYDVYVPDAPLYPNKCHVEYCHPGTWQLSEQAPLVAPAAALPAVPVVAAPQQSVMGVLSSKTMMYGIAGVVAALLVIYMLRKRLLRV